MTGALNRKIGRSENVVWMDDQINMRLLFVYKYQP